MPPQGQGAARAPKGAPNLPPAVARFWERVAEGQSVGELWEQLRADADSSFRLYYREVAREPVAARPTFRQWLDTARRLFWAILLKLSPVRRVALVAAGVLALLALVNVRVANVPSFGLLAGLIVFALLLLEIADRVVLKRDLELAKEIQGWLLPKGPLAIPNLDIAFTTRPANTVAGDYYDVIPLESGAGSPVLIAVADVVGKGIPAAVLMATFQASLRTLAQASSSLPELTAAVNRYVCTNSPQGLGFTTAFLAEYHPAGGELFYINAGHNAPFLRRAGGALERLAVGGIPFGIAPEAHYEVGALTLHPDDRLVVFTDGMVEATDLAGEEFGEARLQAMVTIASPGAGAAAELQRLMAAIAAHVGAARQHDDITCLIARRT